MSVIVLVVGILVTGAGLASLGFGIPINDLAIGQTLIIAGSTGLCAGLLLIALAAAVSQLSQIAEVLKGKSVRPAARAAEAQPRSEMPATVSEMQQARPEPQLQRPEPPPLRAPALRPAEVPPPETRPVGQPAVDVSASAIERLRSSLPRPERVVPEAEAAPLSPNGGTHPPAVPAAEVKPVEVAPVEAAPAEIAPRLDFLFRSRQPRAGQPPENFDAVWPKRPTRQGEPAGRVAEAQGSATLERPEPPAPPRPEPVAAPTAEARSAAILKSGVVDGMAYTLYADGSIEAQLPQGTVRFGSIVELREHIENNS